MTFSSHLKILLLFDGCVLEDSSHKPVVNSESTLLSFTFIRDTSPLSKYPSLSLTKLIIPPKKGDNTYTCFLPLCHLCTISLTSSMYSCMRASSRARKETTSLELSDVCS